MQIKLRTFVFVIVLFVIAMFAAVNWALFMAPSTINLLFGTVVAPLGVVMLLVVAGLSVLYLLILARAEAGALIGNHRTSKELEEARKLALSAEESRLRELRADLDERLGRIEMTLTDLVGRTGPAADHSTVVKEGPSNSHVTTNEEIVR